MNHKNESTIVSDNYKIDSIIISDSEFLNIPKKISKILIFL